VSLRQRVDARDLLAQFLQQPRRFGSLDLQVMSLTLRVESPSTYICSGASKNVVSILLKAGTAREGFIQVYIRRPVFLKIKKSPFSSRLRL